ncbi:hypothetical protein TNCV_337201 [Trichonephila clavipes]|nr:hypothetical protein TNCV_337201 [Trichonephila clavipes]
MIQQKFLVVSLALAWYACLQDRRFSVKRAKYREEGAIYRSEKLASSHFTYITLYGQRKSEQHEIAIKQIKCRINIKFLEKLKKSATKTFQILTEAYGNETLCRAYVFESYEQLSEGRDSVEEEKRAGLPRQAITNQNIAKNHDMSGNLLLGLPKTSPQNCYQQ